MSNLSFIPNKIFLLKATMRYDNSSVDKNINSPEEIHQIVLQYSTTLSHLFLLRATSKNREHADLQYTVSNPFKRHIPCNTTPPLSRPSIRHYTHTRTHDPKLPPESQVSKSNANTRTPAFNPSTHARNPMQLKTPHTPRYIPQSPCRTKHTTRHLYQCLTN